MRRRVAMAVVAASLVVVGIVGTDPMTAVATDGERVVTEDTTLTEDHNGNIVIDADGITLDCAGHTVTGGGSGFGILLDGRTGVTVANCVVTNFTLGILLSGSDGNSLAGNVAFLNGQHGIELNLSDNNTLDRNRADDNGFGAHATFGFFLLGSSNNVLTDNGARGNGETNFNLAEAGLDTPNGNTLTNNTASGGDRGFVVIDGDGNSFVANRVTNVAVHGFESGALADNNLFQDNWVSGAGGEGFRWGGSGNNFASNDSHGNGGHGFVDLSVPGANTYTANLCVGNNIEASQPAGLCNSSGSFSDDDGNTFEVDIEWMNWEGITKGCNPPANDEYCPDDSVTRGQMAAFLVRALGYTDDGGGDLFTDDNSSVFENDIDKLATAGVTKGCNPPTNDRYCPDDFVTRGQMAAFLVRALGYTDDGGGDLFIDDDGSTFEDDIDKLGTAGVTKGCNPPANDEFCPNDFVTRGQMAAFLRRALES